MIRAFRNKLGQLIEIDDRCLSMEDYSSLVLLMEIGIGVKIPSQVNLSINGRISIVLVQEI